MNAQEFAKTHSHDADWLNLMSNREIKVLSPGQKGTYSGFPVTVIKHYHNGMYVIRGASGSACISGSEFIPQ